ERWKVLLSGSIERASVARLSSGADSLLDLTLILGAVEVAQRLGDEAVSTDPPLLETAEANPLPSPSRPGVGADERPAVHSVVTFYGQFVHDDCHVGERGHESLSHLGDGTTTNSRRSVIDTERSAGRVEGSHTRGILAPPRCV